MIAIKLKVMPVSHEGVQVKLPTKATAGSAGFDLYAAIAEPVEVKPGGLVRVPTGIAVGFPSGEYVGLVFARSGLATKHGVTLSNSVGVIDSDYTGEILVGLCNVSDKSYILEPGERFAQLVIMPVIAAELVKVDSLDATERSDGGFGSTGKY